MKSARDFIAVDIEQCGHQADEIALVEARDAEWRALVEAAIADGTRRVLAAAHHYRAIEHQARRDAFAEGLRHAKGQLDYLAAKLGQEARNEEDRGGDGGGQEGPAPGG